jgi:hypothetical protein
MVLLRNVGRHYGNFLAHSMGHRGVDSELQQPTCSNLIVVCLVVHVWHEWHILVVLELGRVRTKLEEDVSDSTESGNRGNGSRDLWYWIVREW